MQGLEKLDLELLSKPPLPALGSPSHTAIPYRAITGPVQGFPCVLFPHREKPVFITGFPGDENRVFPFGKSTQGNPCFHYTDGFPVHFSPSF